MEIAIPIFDRLTALDAVGPYEVLSRFPGARVRFLAESIGAKRTENGMLALSADVDARRAADPEVIVVPGGLGTRALLHDETILSWLRRGARDLAVDDVGVHRVAAARRRPGSSRASRRRRTGCRSRLLRDYGAIPVSRRVVEQGKVITAAGVSAGIDMALTLAARIAGEDVAQAIQLGIEYDPEPPFDSGSVDKAPDELVEQVQAQRPALRLSASVLDLVGPLLVKFHHAHEQRRVIGEATAFEHLSLEPPGARPPADVHVIRSASPGMHEAVELQLADVEVASEHSRRPRRPTRAASQRHADPAPRRPPRAGSRPTVPSPSRAACIHRRSGSEHSL